MKFVAHQIKNDCHDLINVITESEPDLELFLKSIYSYSIKIFFYLECVPKVDEFSLSGIITS